MPGSARAIQDLWYGICCCHENPTCIPMGGRIIEGSSDVISVNYGQARLADLTIGWCGHIGRIVTGSQNVQSNSKSAAFVTSEVHGCNIGKVITGAPTHIIN